MVSIPPNREADLPRLFVEHPLAPGGTIALSREQTNYLANVLRMRAGAPLLVFNGRDGEFEAVLAAARREASLVVGVSRRPQTAASRLVCAFAPLKHARLDYMVQKAVEMGAGRLAPVITRRTQVTRVNRDRMRANAVEAAEQCGILAVPEVLEPIALEDFVDGLAADTLVVFCDEAAPIADPIAALRRPRRQGGGALAVLIGPEGGFDPMERASLHARPNVLGLSLGPRIMRADTAAVAALALVQACLGDWRVPLTSEPCALASLPERN
jgi:16S rRNA (uracil1498-N3)-methyltransferase